MQVSALFFENLLSSRAVSPHPPTSAVADLQTHSSDHCFGRDILWNYCQAGLLALTSVMINTERNANGMAGGGTPTPAHDKKLPGSVKKTALRDLQNENVGTIHKQQENILPGGGKSCGDTVKVCGNKRLTPERPSSSQGLPYSTYNGTNENVMNARRRFELELGMGRLHNNVEKKITSCSESKNAVSQLRQDVTQKPMKNGNLHPTPNNLTAIMAFSSSGPSVPNSLGKHGNSTPVAKISQESTHTIDFKTTNDLLRTETERFIRLQKFLKQCDESNQRDYTQTLMHLPPSELSKHAVELEKRAIQLTIEEGNEMQRMKALNIFIKPSPGSTLTGQLLQANKR
ncbi:uncharacterized protein LOC130994975 [Salvia miltiorrhiza]|uniref:uncharacterized protein LOC130994975 n=1 Tax=Salvia miltiorrhiza TaxID=226208 RepID=UPI0025AC52BB|nr:uncharacterized protein LOC130994975 [Salvia miltiorrhiza]